MANLARRSPFAFSGMSRYRDTGRRMVGGFGSYARRANTGIQSYGSSALARYNEARKSDTLGGLFADEMGTMVAVGGAGVFDASSVGQRFTEFTGGRMRPSTALFVAGAIARGFGGLDKRFLGSTIARANSRFIRGMLVVKSYEIGARVPAVLGGGFNVSTIFGSDAAQLSGVESTPAASQAYEPIPGEVTMS